jgi:hypothetical protein
MCFARNSFTSLWRGTGWGYSGLRVEIPIVFPAVSNEHPASSILRIRSICFIQWSVRPLCEYLESHCSSGPDVDHGGSLRVLPPFSPESGSPGTLQSSPATYRHFASERTEPCSYDYFTNGKRGVLGPDLRLDRGKPTFPMVDFGVVRPIREAAEVAIPLLARGMLVRPSGETKSIMGRASEYPNGTSLPWRSSLWAHPL